MSGLTIACPSCSVHHKIDATQVGRKIKCQCGMSFTASPIFAVPDSSKPLGDWLGNKGNRLAALNSLSPRQKLLAGLGALGFIVVTTALATWLWYRKPASTTPEPDNTLVAQNPAKTPNILPPATTKTTPPEAVKNENPPALAKDNPAAKTPIPSVPPGSETLNPPLAVPGKTDTPPATPGKDGVPPGTSKSDPLSPPGKTETPPATPKTTPPSPPGPMENSPMKPAYVLRGIKLWDSYDIDREAAEMKYNAKVLEVSLPIRLERDADGRLFLGLPAKKPGAVRPGAKLTAQQEHWEKQGYPANLRCYLAEGQASLLDAMKPGEEISIRGVCQGRVDDPHVYRGYVVELEDCRVVLPPKTK